MILLPPCFVSILTSSLSFDKYLVSYVQLLLVVGSALRCLYTSVRIVVVLKIMESWLTSMRGVPFASAT